MTTDSESSSRRQVGGRDILTSIIVGLLLAGSFIGSLVWDPIAFSAFVAILVTIGVIETAAALGRVGIGVSGALLSVASVATIAATYEWGHRGQSLAMVGLFAGVSLILIAEPDRQDAVRRVGATMLMGLWGPLFASFGVLLILRPTDAPAVVFGVIAAAVFTDIGGFAFGVAFGRHKIAPTVSPAKSWEGLIGGLALAMGLSAFLLPLLSDVFDVPTAVILALSCGIAGFFGDLVESMFKRDLGVKDLGTILPGHGGLFDRMDGVLFALPAGWSVLELLGR